MVGTGRGVEPRYKGTGAGLIDFLTAAIRDNVLVESTGSALRTGCLKVLAEAENPNTLDIRTADLDDLVAEFRQQNARDMKERTLDQYEQRFRQSVEMYRKWLDNDPSWRPKPSQYRLSSPPSGGRVMRETSRGRFVTVRDDTTSLSGSPQLIEYPFPIRIGVRATVRLPEDLTENEARRISDFIQTLVLNENPDSENTR